MQLLLLGINAMLSNLFMQYEQQAYFYYYIFIFAGLVLSLAFSYRELKKAVSGISRRSYAYLAIIIILFLALELLFVQPTHLLYNDEYIYVSMAKMLITEHLAGVCSFSNATMCVPGTAGFFHQPLGLSFLIAIPSSVFGVSFTIAYVVEMLLAISAVLLTFYIAYIIFNDKVVPLVAAAILAFTPLFMRYAMSNLVDLPAAAFLLLSVFLVLAYMRRKSAIVGIAAVFSVAYMLSMKVDMILGIAVLPLVLLLSRDRFEGPNAKRQLIRLLLLLVLAAFVIAPALLYIYEASFHSFGAALNQSKFSLSNFESNLPGNALFWFGKYDTILSSQNYTYNDEFPLTYTIFALAGAAFLLYGKRFREFSLLALWFAVVFVFYASYYAGSINYAAGTDVRYLVSAFPVIAIMGAYGFARILSIASGKPRKPAKAKRAKRREYLAMLLLLVLLFAEAAWLFATIVTLPPLKMYPFAAERYDQQLIMQHYQQIPSNCVVLTFKPILWYVLGRGNIYAGWINMSSYSQELQNISKGCLYFDYSVSCYIAYPANTGYPNTSQQCLNVIRTYKLQPIASTSLDNYSWNASFYLYKIIGLNTTNSS